MKERSVVLLLVLTLVGKAFCFELKQTPRDKLFTQFESNKDLYIIYHNAYLAEDDEIMKKAYNEEKFVLFVNKMSFEDFFYKEKDSLGYHCPFYKIENPDLEKVFECYRQDKRYWTGGTLDFTKRKIIEKKSCMIEQIFSSRNYNLSTNLIGGYSMDLISRDGNVYHFWLADPCSYINDDKLCKQLTDYVVYETRDNITTYFWKSYEVTDRFYDNMVAKKNTLPAYVIKFQNTWESIVNSFD